MTTPQLSRTFARLAPALFVILWSSGFSAVSIGLRWAGPLTFLSVRYLLVLALLLPFLLLMRPPLPASAAQWLHLAVVGVLVQFGYFAMVNLALHLGASATAVALVMAMQPVLVALFAPGLAGEQVSSVRWFGLLLGLAGAAVVIVARGELRVSPLGVLAAVGGLAGFTAGTMYEKRFGVGQHPVTSNFVQYVVGLLLALPLALAVEHWQVRWTAGFVGTVSYLAIANSLLAMTLLLAMIRQGEASRVSALFFLVPPVAGLMAWALLGESLGPIAWAGMALATVGVAIGGYAGRR